MTDRTLTPGFLRCDACDYCDTVMRDMTPDLIGTPCPTCGADMLTREDYEKNEAIMAALQPLVEMGLVKVPSVGDPVSPEAVRVRTHKNEIIITMPEGKTS